jgi:hypothetical protein
MVLAGTFEINEINLAHEIFISIGLDFPICYRQYLFAANYCKGTDACRNKRWPISLFGIRQWG